MMAGPPYRMCLHFPAQGFSTWLQGTGGSEAKEVNYLGISCSVALRPVGCLLIDTAVRNGNVEHEGDV